MALDVIEAGVSQVDDCPVLTRIKTFLVDEGVAATLQHTFIDRTGSAVDLSQDSTSDDSATSASASDDTVVLRVKEFTGPLDSSRVLLVAIAGTITAASAGTVRATLPSAIVNKSGLYQLSWGFFRDGVLLYVNAGLLSVERSLYGAWTAPTDHQLGPPTIGEIRMQLMDSHSAENVLLDDVEFGDDQIAMAVVKPIMEFNEMNPPLGFIYTTLDFPYRNAWLDAIVGYLLQFAAHNYRRNRLSTRAGGVTVDDKGKEPEYLRASELAVRNWRDWALRKKVEINAMQAVGTVSSTYGALG